MAQIEKTVFISYRRKDISWALAVYQYLTSQKYDVFFDYTHIPSGDFEQIIVSNIKARAHFVLILTPTALDRTSNSGDWLRREIETAIDEKRNIIPLFFDDFSFSSPNVKEKLTGKMADISRYNGLEIPSGFFIEAMERLRKRYINVPLDAVLHPISSKVKKVVNKEKANANNALLSLQGEIDELVGSIKDEGEISFLQMLQVFLSGVVAGGNLRRKLNIRPYIFSAGILFLAVLCFLGVRSLKVNTNTEETPAPTQSVDAIEITLTPNKSVSTGIAFSTISIPASSATVPLVTATPKLNIGSTLTGEDGMTLLYIPAGEFTMGLDGDNADNPAHVVNLDAFWIDRTEVTISMYTMCVDEGSCIQPRSNGSRTQSSYYDNPKFGKFPVVWVRWDYAMSYCKWAGRRLPSEAEWEKAARGPEGYVYPWGNNYPTIDLSNYDDLIRDTTAVDDYLEGASPYGALNMAGNALEWVTDFYDSVYYINSRSSNPTGPLMGVNRVMRGGSYKDTVSDIRAVYRYERNPLEATSYIGFRCAMDAE